MAVKPKTLNNKTDEIKAAPLPLEGRVEERERGSSNSCCAWFTVHRPQR